MIDNPDDVTILSYLVNAGEHIVARRLMSIETGTIERLCELTVDVSRPVPEGGGHLHPYTAMYAQSVRRGFAAMAAKDRDEHRVYAQLLGVLLPYLREDLSRAIAARTSAVAVRPTP